MEQVSTFRSAGVICTVWGQGQLCIDVNIGINININIDIYINIHIDADLKLLNIFVDINARGCVDINRWFNYAMVN